jgi:hypothetical protein
VGFVLGARRLALAADVPDDGEGGPDQRHRTEDEDAVQNLHGERITNRRGAGATWRKAAGQGTSRASTTSVSITTCVLLTQNAVPQRIDADYPLANGSPFPRPKTRETLALQFSACGTDDRAGWKSDSRPLIQEKSCSRKGWSGEGSSR